MEIFTEAWAWLGREVAEFGVRWLFVGVVMFGIIKWLKDRDLRKIRTEIDKCLADTSGNPIENNWSLKGRSVTYKTVHGELKVRYQSVHSAHEDFVKWLKDNHLLSHMPKYNIRVSDDHVYKKDD